jgi:aerobic carbon-monoxide dehydrogenase large subunit
VYDSASFLESLELVCSKAGYATLRAEQSRLRARGRYLGIGLGCYVEITAFGSKTPASPGTPINPGHEAATVRVEPSGAVTVLCGVAPSGQAHATTLAQIAADGLGVPLETIRVITGDTAATAYGLGTFASRSAVLAGGAVMKATAVLAEKICRIAATLLEASADDVEIVAGRVQVRGTPATALPLRQVAQLAYYQIKQLPSGLDPGLDVTAYYDPQWGTSANGAHLAVVEVDAETGHVTLLRYVAVEDCGTQINPLIVEGQTHGGIAQGIGSALYEELIYDTAGQLLTGSLMDYLLPGVREMPRLEISHLVTPSTITLGGLKGTGEGGTLGATAAVPNAVADALRPLGVRLTEIPLTPERIVTAVHKALCTR